MMLVASSLLALLEASRFHELQRLTQLQTQIAFESVFGKYNNDLWKEYHILSCKRDSLENGLLEFGNRRIEDKDAGSNFFQFFATDVDVESFMRLTDADGLVFVQAAAGYMEESLLFEAAKELYNRYEGIKNLQEGSFYDFSSIERALDALEKEDDFSNSIGSTGENLAEGRKKEERISSGKNLLIEIQNLQRNGVLSLVIEDINMLSNKEIELSQMISHRILPEKNMSFSTETDWYTRVLFQQYLLKHMSCYTKQEGHEMDYELEYIIGGKNTESENLKVVVNQLLAMREAANFAYLLSCPSKIEEANILAISIVGGTLNPMVVEVVKLAILAAWAFAESTVR